MKKIFSLPLVIMLSLSFGIIAQEAEKKQVKKVVKKEKVVDVKPVNTICPVSSEEADPEKYISRLREDGKSIKKKKVN